MKWMDRLKNRFAHPPSGRAPGQIVINSRSDLPLSGNEWISAFPNTLLCSDGTEALVEPVNSLLTGYSHHKNEILIRQIIAAVKAGYTPLVLSSKGKHGAVYEALRTIYAETDMEYVSEECAGGCYDPFEGVSVDKIADFFYRLICDFQEGQTNGMLVRNYVNVCSAVFFSDSAALSGLAAGRLNHLALLDEIERMYREGTISVVVRDRWIDAADAAQSVSAAVLSVMQDYLYQMRNVISSAQPSIQLPSMNTPHIRILSVNGNTASPSPGRVRVRGGFSLSAVAARQCFYVQMNNEIPQNRRNSLNGQCFQWYMAHTMKLEFSAKEAVRNARILLIIDELSDTLLNWFWWMLELPDCRLLLTYDDFYAKLSGTPDCRQQLIGRMRAVYFFSVMNDESASWASQMFGTHKVSKVVVTEQPGRDWVDVLFPPKSYAHDEIEKPWFSTHEIRHLGNMGIVYLEGRSIFRPCYRENGRTYVDRKYRGRVNFCLFEFQ